MEPHETIWIGLTRGITSILPVSDTGHLRVLERAYEGHFWEVQEFASYLSFGILLALIIFAWQKLPGYLNRKMVGNLLWTTAPVLLAAFLFGDKLAGMPFFRELMVVAVIMAIGGVLIMQMHRLPRMRQSKKAARLDNRRAFLIGLAQVFARVPGMSGTCTSILAGWMVGLDKLEALAYTIVSSIPITLGFCIYQIIFGFRTEFAAQNVRCIIGGNLIAGIATYLTLNWFYKYVQKTDSLKAFGWYRIVFAMILMIFGLLR